MKPLYVIILFFIVFQISALMIASLNIFEDTLYSDFDLEELSEHNTPQGMLTYLFVPEGTAAGWIGGDFTIPALVAIFLGIGTAFSFVTQSFTPISIVVVGLIFTPMVTKSMGFFNQLFSVGGTAVWYIGILLGVSVLVIVVITIIEMPTQGRS